MMKRLLLLACIALLAGCEGEQHSGHALVGEHLAHGTHVVLTALFVQQMRSAQMCLPVSPSMSCAKTRMRPAAVLTLPSSA